MHFAVACKFKVWGILWDYRLSISCSPLCWYALDTLTIYNEILNNRIACIFRNVSNGTIIQAISTQPSITIASLVWWPGCQPACAHKRPNSIQTPASFRITWAMHTALSEQALTCLPPLDLVVQGKARLASHWLFSLGCWSNLNPNQEHTVVWMHLQRVDPISSVEVHTTVLQKVSMLYFVNNF
jgi:hypothetical protein